MVVDKRKQDIRNVSKRNLRGHMIPINHGCEPFQGSFRGGRWENRLLFCLDCVKLKMQISNQGSQQHNTTPLTLQSQLPRL